MAAKSGTLTGSPRRSTAMTSLIRCWARSSPTASTMKRRTPAGSAWESIMTLPSVRWRRSDGGGSNGSRCRLWKVELQPFANESGLGISVCHFPPGTSKCNKIEHRMFCHITENWRGRPLVSREVVVNLIGHTTTKTGLTIRSELDENIYPTGREVTAQQLESLAIKRDKFHGEWNYTIRPKT